MHVADGVRSLVLLGVLALACAVAPAPAPVATTPVEDPDDAIEEFVALANQERRASGCTRDLVWSDDVAAVAQAHSEHMRRRGFFEHVDPDGRTPMNRVQAAGIPVMAVAENIALGQPTGRAVFESWRDSPGHRRNMLNCEYGHHGVGLAGAYWTHVLVRLR